MKKIFFPIMIVVTLAACKSKTKDAASTDSASTQTTAGNSGSDSAEVKTASDSGSFDINKIPVTDKDPGEFPYLKPPATYSYNYHTEASDKNILANDKEYFAVNGRLIPIEGKTYKINVERSRVDDKRFNAAEVEKSFTTTIDSLGGIQVNNVPVPEAEIKRVGNAELIDKHYGASIDMNMLDAIKTFVIHTKDKQIWIQFTLMNEESGKITVLEKAN